MSRRNRQVAALTGLSALLAGGLIFFLSDGDDVALFSGRRRMAALQSSSDAARQLAAADLAREAEGRVLAMAGTSPPTADEVPGEFIIKPYVGYAMNSVYETASANLNLHSAQASTTAGDGFLPRHALDSYPHRWSSSTTAPAPEEWLQIDTGDANFLQILEINWHETSYASSYVVQIAPERPNCRSNGGPCPDYWITVATVSGKASGSTTSDNLESGDMAIPPEGVRYVRILLQQRAAGQPNYSVYQVKVYRKATVVGETPTGTYCGATTGAVTSTLLGSHGGTLIQTFETAGFFHATLSAAQRDAMNANPCTFAVEPNYVVKARGRTTGGPGRLGAWRKHKDENKGHVGKDRPRGRRLAIPEFNLRDENPPNWGLPRVASHGRMNGKYMWFHEGEDTHLYVFDTGIYADHSEFTTSASNEVTQGQKDAEDIHDWEMEMRNQQTTRIDPNKLVCTGTATDFTLNDHGTHVASIAAGFTMGTGKSTTLHSLQVLDANGEGTTASVLCGVERVISDAQAYYAANPVGEDTEKYQGVVNLSLGVDGRSDMLDRAVLDMTQLGVIVVIAAGDNNDNACFYSPYHPAAITVGAVSFHAQGFNEKTLSSNFGQCVDIWGPGEDIAGASNAGEYESVSKSGTSVAAAFVSGAATLFLESSNTDELLITEVTAWVKEKMVNKAEINILGELGHGSPSKMLQTTVSKCLVNKHCDVGLTCLFDGTCRDLSKPLKAEY